MRLLILLFLAVPVIFVFLNRFIFLKLLALLFEIYYWNIVLYILFTMDYKHLYLTLATLLLHIIKIIYINRMLLLIITLYVDQLSKF